MLFSICNIVETGFSGLARIESGLRSAEKPFGQWRIEVCLHPSRCNNLCMRYNQSRRSFTSNWLETWHHQKEDVARPLLMPTVGIQDIEHLWHWTFDVPETTKDHFKLYVMLNKFIQYKLFYDSFISFALLSTKITSWVSFWRVYIFH